MPEERRKPIIEILYQARLLAALVLGGSLGVFALQNLAKVELTFLFWTFESRRIVVIALSMIIGLILGGLFGISVGRKLRRDEIS